MIMVYCKSVCKFTPKESAGNLPSFIIIIFFGGEGGGRGGVFTLEFLLKQAGTNVSSMVGVETFAKYSKAQASMPRLA